MKTLNFLPLIFLSSLFSSSSPILAAFSELGYSTVYESPGTIKGEYNEPNPSPKISYDRIIDVRRNCKSVLSSASELNIDSISRDLRKSKKNLSFRYGDWSQPPGDSPILPFDSTNNTSSSPSTTKPMNLVSFRVTDLDLPHRTKRYVGVNGVLLLAITTFNDLTLRGAREFELWPSHTQLKINFQGVYVENDNDQERVLCMLGETMLPSRETNSPSDHPWKWVKEHDTPPLLQDDQIRLILRYPKTFTLTKRKIQGEVKSLNEKSNLKYFDKISISSQLSKSVQYSFVSDELVSKACDKIKGVDDVYKGKGFCNLLQRVVSNSPLTVLPNWKCNGTDDFCSKLGPFAADGDIKLTDGGFKDVKLYMQNIHCQENSDAVTKVSAVFRAVHPNENLYLSGMRSGLDNMTVTAEGVWKPSIGQLCMVACRRGEADGCNGRVCVYIPTTFSIRQRSILVGTFSCLNTEKNLTSSFFPLSFEKLVEPMDMQNYFQSSSDSHPVYRYSKTDEAGSILERNQEFSFTTIIKKSVMKFPKLEDSEDSLSSLSLLAEDLTFHTPAFTEKQALGTNFGMDVLSLGPLFGLFWRSSNVSVEDQLPYKTKDQYTEKQLLLNVSAQISLTGEPFGNVSKIYLEGLYDERTGRMYLVGCRDVRASWEVLSASGDLEAGLDCLVDVVVSYPPIKSRWLADPTAKVSISSRRPDDDPLYFKPVKLKTTPIFYRRQREDILSRAGVEGILRVLTLTFSIGCITSQLFYFRTKTDSVPFVSLVMLGVQALGYSLPLITGAEALFKRKEASGTMYATPSYDLQRSQWFNVIDYTVKLLVMVCFLLTLRLCQKVWKSRVRMLTKTPQVPSDRRVFVISLFLHALGYILALVLHPARTERFTQVYGNGTAATNWWQTETEEYIGLVQDFFLLPQVIANFIWQIDSKQPLRKLYYLGITLVKLFPHVYDYMIGSVPDPYFIGEEHEFVNPNLDFYSKFGDVAIPVTAILLAVIVFVQQRWDYDRLSQALSFGRFRILPSRSVKYERVISESEMVSGVCANGNHSDEE